MTRRETYVRDAAILQEARYQRGQFKVQFSADALDMAAGRT